MQQACWVSGDMAVESFVRCAQLELAGAVPGKEATFIDLLKPEYELLVLFR